jgi:hypothetical protein
VDVDFFIMTILHSFRRFEKIVIETLFLNSRIIRGSRHYAFYMTRIFLLLVVLPFIACSDPGSKKPRLSQHTFQEDQSSNTDVMPDFEVFWKAFRAACLCNEQNQLMPLIADSFLVEGFEDGDKVHLTTNSDSIWAIVQSFLYQKGTVAYGGSWSIDPILETEVYSNPIVNHRKFIKKVSDLKQYPNLIEDQNWKRIENMNFHCLAGEWKFTGVYMSLKE